MQCFDPIGRLTDSRAIKMPKANTGKRKAEAEEGGPNTKRQRAATGTKVARGKAAERRKSAVGSVLQKPVERNVELDSLPDNVLAKVFCELGLDRLRAMQGK